MRLLGSRSIFVISCLVFAAASQPAICQPAGLSQDVSFVNTAASGGMLEVQLGQLAQLQAASEEVKAFAVQMVQDHSIANSELTKIAANKGISVPEKLSPKHQECYDQLKQLTGADFDRKYIKKMVKDHEETVALFTAETQRGSDRELVSFASEKLPALEHHLEMARGAAANIKGPECR